MDEQESPQEISITVSANVEILDPRSVLPPLEGDEEHPEPPPPESFKLQFVLPGSAEDAAPNEVQCGSTMIHIQTVDEAYIQTLVSTPATFKLVREDGTAVGDYSVSLASWAMGTPKAVRQQIAQMNEEVATLSADESSEAEVKEQAIAALTQQRSDALLPWAIDFKWEMDAEELQVGATAVPLDADPAWLFRFCFDATLSQTLKSCLRARSCRNCPSD